MNGRVYDPKIGRFLSPDPIVQAPFNSQSVGRYSYVWNNPASSIDPSGFQKQPNCNGCDEVIAVGHRTDQDLSEELAYYSSGGYDWNAASAADTSASGSADSGGGVADRPLVVHIVCDASCYQRPQQSPEEPASSPTWNNFHLGLSALSIGLDASAVGAAISWVPDLLDAGLSLSEGDWTGAGLSVAGMVPFAGAIADAAKLTRIAARAEATTLYRAVSTAEYADIVGSGVLRAGPNSFSTGKWFWESAEHAAQFGTKMDGAGNFRIIEATFPRSAAEQFMRLDRLDGIGPARFGTFEQLGNPLLRPLLGAP
jgi:hypothetical protein